jgi:hypothetical protein
MTEDTRLEAVREYADLLARYPGAIPSGDVAWKLRRILNDPNATVPDAEVTATAEVALKAATFKDVQWAKRRLFGALIAVSDRLDKPYTDAPEHTPWSQLVSPAMSSLDRMLDCYANGGERP